MAVSTDTESLYSPGARDMQREYHQWSKAHQRIKNSPAQEGRDYVRHARNLLPILEGFAELHPIAKAVVTGFKAVIMYEDDRKENDARVDVVFLSQSDMMRTLLDANQLSMRRKGRLGNEAVGQGLYSDPALSDILLRVEREIRACGNSMDTYYKESRFVKFWKSQEWKERILGHATKFDQFRILLQQTLSIQVASDVSNMLEKMDILLLRLFAPKADWEKEIVVKARQLGKPKDSRDSNDLVNDISTLQTLVAITKDPLLDAKNAGEDNSTKAGFKAALPTQIEQLRKELHLSLDVLCDRNQGMFELKLNYHTQQLQETIRNSAQYVIRSLSGPYDRLHNKDLQILWKEMKWIFCVDNTLFTSAIFEYYLDHFSTIRQEPTARATDGANDGILQLSAEDEAEKTQKNLTKVTFLTRLGVLNHVDAWTLEPIAMYGHRISTAIDRDESGFIRISEVNAFTEQMPKGWNLPQWCAYAALGEAYEARIYRKRIHNILARMMEMQERVLPLNRGFVAISTVPQITPFFQLLAWQPSTCDDTDPDPPAELRLLVHEKIKQQDDVWRKKLASFNWTVEDEATLQLLYGKTALESYVLQLSVLLLEYAYDVMQACCFVTVDVKEMSHILSPLRFLQRTCMDRVDAMQTQFKKEKKPSDYMETFSGGIWYAVDYSLSNDDSDDEENDDDDDKLQKANNAEGPVPFELEDVFDFLADEAVLEDFPLRPLVEGELPYLEYETWEEHVLSIPEDEIPDTIPNSWNDEDEDDSENDEDDYGSRYNWTEFPLAYRTCNKCKKCPIREHHYVCTECTALDLCSECSQLPADEHILQEHDFSHPMLRFALHTVPIQREWLVLEAQAAIQQMQEDIRNMWEQIIMPDDADDAEADSEEEDADGNDNSIPKEVKIASPYSCNNCEETIPLDSATTFYKCLSHLCDEDYMLCESCIDEQIVNEDPEEHQWWHSMLVLRRDIVTVGDDSASSDSTSDDESESSDKKKNGADSAAIISAIGERISEVEAKLDTTNSMLQEALSTILEDKATAVGEDDENLTQTQALEMRMSQLEDKVDGMVIELRSFMRSFSERFSD